MPTRSVPNTSEIPTEARARRMFCAVLERWACDCLELRARGLDRPSVRRGDGFGPMRPAPLRVSVTTGVSGRVSPRWAG